MREILFRAKRVDNGEWVEGYYANCYFSTKGDTRTGHFIIRYPDEFCEIYTGTLCQYTGLTDKNGQKIWENDILRYSYEYLGSPWLKEKGFTDNDIKYYIGAVFWSDWRGTWAVCGYGKDRNINQDVFTYSRNPNRVEAVGNIFDNPDLIEKRNTERR